MLLDLEILQLQVFNKPVLSKDTTTGIVKLNSFYYTTDSNGNNPTIKPEYSTTLHTDDLNPVEHQISGDSNKYRIINNKSQISNDFKGNTIITYNYVTTLITDMTTLFINNASFNRNISGWDVSNVKTMIEMFRGTTSFNQNIGNWNVSKVTTTKDMFYDCSVFNQPLNNWNVSNVTDMRSMFINAIVFNQPLYSWNV